MRDLRNRLFPDWFVNDEVFGVGLGPGTPTNPTAVWLPERMMDRIRHVARAYELHLLPLVEAESTYFNAKQASNLIDELEFVREVVADPYLHQCAAQLIALLAEARNSVGATFEGP